MPVSIKLSQKSDPRLSLRGSCHCDPRVVAYIRVNVRYRHVEHSSPPPHNYRRQALPPPRCLPSASCMYLIGPCSCDTVRHVPSFIAPCWDGSRARGGPSRGISRGLTHNGEQGTPVPHNRMSESRWHHVMPATDTSTLPSVLPHAEHAHCLLAQRVIGGNPQSPPTQPTPQPASDHQSTRRNKSHPQKLDAVGATA
jgi:hypothetical protein